MSAATSLTQVSYAAATPAELRAQAAAGSRAVGLVNQSALFPHHGILTLDRDTLTLSGYRTVLSDDLVSVEQKFIPEYSRFAAGGIRGGFPSLGFMKKQGAPLVLQLKNDESIVLLLGFEPVTGTTKNREWLDSLKEFARHA